MSEKNEHGLKKDVDVLFGKMIKRGMPLWYLKVHGGPYQRAGIHDYLLCVNGWFGSLELKHPDDEPEYSPSQSRQAAWVRSAGGLLCLTNKIEVCEQFVAEVGRI